MLFENGHNHSFELLSYCFFILARKGRQGGWWKLENRHFKMSKGNNDKVPSNRSILFHAPGTIYPLLVGHNLFHSDTIYPWYTQAEQKQKPFYKLAIFKISLHLNLIFPFVVFCEFWVHFGPLFWQSLKKNLNLTNAHVLLLYRNLFLLIYAFFVFFAALSWNCSWLLSTHSHHNQFICSAEE